MPSAAPLRLAMALAATVLHSARAANPVGGATVAGYVPGMADPNLHFFDGKFSMWATHDFSVNNTGFTMKDWWIWSSPDLVSWTKESVVSPETSLKWDTQANECWATDAAWVNGTYFFYVSAGGGQVGVMSSKSLAGPWSDPLGKPLLSGPFAAGLKPPTTFRDPCVFQDPDTKEYYIIAGVFTYYVMKLAPDMISLAETPKLIEFSSHVYGPCGDNKTDDKPFLHKNADTFYLSWGCFYASSKSVYGPYEMQGAVIDTAKIAKDFQCDGQPGQCGKASEMARLRASGKESDLARAEAIAPYTEPGLAAAEAGDSVVLYACNNATAGRASWVTTPATPAPGSPFSVHPTTNHSLCVTAPGTGGDGTRLALQPCGGGAEGIQQFVRNATGKGDDVRGIHGCRCWNVNDGSAHSAGPHGRNDMIVQCFSCVDGVGFNPNQRWSFTEGQIQAWHGYAPGYCLASAPPSAVPAPAPAPPSGPKPWYLQEDYTDRHGSFLKHGSAGNWYYASNDRSHSKDTGHEGVFRDTVLCYIHFRANGTMESCSIDAQGVNSHDLAFKAIEAEEFFTMEGGGARKVDLLDAGGGDGFAVGAGHGALLRYPHVSNLRGKVVARVAASAAGRVELRANSTSGVLLATCPVSPTGGLAAFEDVRCPLAQGHGGAEVELVVAVLRDEDGQSGEFLRLDSLRLA